MKTEEWELEQINTQNSQALKRIENLYLALNDLEAFERAVLGGGKNSPARQTLRRASRPSLKPSHAN
jgi:hypothetical protein